MPRITDICSCIYVFGCRLNLVRLCDSDFGTTLVDDVTVGITCAVFCLLLLLLLSSSLLFSRGGTLFTSFSEIFCLSKTQGYVFYTLYFSDITSEMPTVIVLRLLNSKS